MTPGSIPGWPPAASRTASRWSNFIFNIKNEMPTPKNLYFDMYDHTLMNDLWIHTWMASSSLQKCLQQPPGRPQGRKILFLKLKMRFPLQKTYTLICRTIFVQCPLDPYLDGLQQPPGRPPVASNVFICDPYYSFYLF